MTTAEKSPPLFRFANTQHVSLIIDLSSVGERILLRRTAYALVDSAAQAIFEFFLRGIAARRKVELPVMMSRVLREAGVDASGSKKRKRDKRVSVHATLRNSATAGCSSSACHGPT